MKKVDRRNFDTVASRVLIACGVVFCIVSAIITKKVTLLSYVFANLLVLCLIFINFLERRKDSDDRSHN